LAGRSSGSLLIRRSLVRAQVGEPKRLSKSRPCRDARLFSFPREYWKLPISSAVSTRQDHARTPSSSSEKQRGAESPRPGRATDRSGVRTRALRLCRALRTTASYPGCAVRPHPRARGSSLAGAGAAAHDEPTRRACILAVMTKGATDKLRPSLLPVLRSFNRRVEGRHEETHRYRHQVREGSLRCAQLHLAQDRAIPAASAALDHIVVVGSVRRSL